jgi:hypothetical protein
VIFDKVIFDEVIFDEVIMPPFLNNEQLDVPLQQNCANKGRHNLIQFRQSTIDDFLTFANLQMRVENIAIKN